MKHILITVFTLVLLNQTVYCQSDQDQIRHTLNNFIFGTTFNYPDSINDSFHPGSRMFLFNEADSVWMITSEKYASFYSRKTPGTRNNRQGKIVTIEVVKDVAYAKLVFDIPSFGNRYYDLVLLKKIAGKWKIIAKCTAAEPIPKSPEKSIIKPVKKTILTGLKRPWSMAFLSEDDALIAEKDGDLLRVNLLTGTKSSISGLPKDIAHAVKIDTSKHAWGVFPPSAHGTLQKYNAGLFQILPDPDFENNSYIYLSYVAENRQQESAVKVIRGKLSNNRLTAVETLFVANPYSHGLFHYGGGMIFGPDGKLYLSTGERNLFEHLNPELPIAQNLTDKRGKIIRINRDGSIPADNPDFGPNAVKGLFASGIRATQGFAINPVDNEIWFSEHGTIRGDEINVLKPGANYGWPVKTSGGYRSKDYKPLPIPGTTFTSPTYFWDKTVAPTGLAFYKGREFAQWDNNLLVPGLSKGSLWRMTISGEKVTSAEELFIDDRVRLRKVIVSPQGKIYLLTDEENGRIIRVINENH